MKVTPAKKPPLEPRFTLPPFTILLSESDEAPDKIQLFRCGTWEHEEYGEITITPEILSEFIDNFRADVRGQDLPGDYSHEAGKKAAAWIKDIFLLGEDEDTTLWARVLWTPDGKRAVENRDFRYASPDFGFQSVDTETGEKFGPTLNGFGLTNRPFLKRMAPIIQLSEKTTEDDEMTLDEAKKQIKELEAKVKKLDEGNTQMADKVAAASDMQKTCDDAGMTPEEMMAKIKELQDQLASQNEQLAELKKSNKDAAVQAAEAKKKAEFDILLSEGKACEAQRPAFMSGNMAEFVKLAEKVNLKAAGSGEPATAKTDVKNEEEAGKEIDRLAKVKLSEKANEGKSYSDCVRLVMAENKELAQKYQPARA